MYTGCKKSNNKLHSLEKLWILLPAQLEGFAFAFTMRWYVMAYTRISNMLFTYVKHSKQNKRNANAIWLKYSN